MAEKISSRLEGQLDVVVPTTIVIVALTSTLLGLVFFTMGWFRVTSISNYMPYPVIAGFLSGIGAELMKNGVHMASSRALSWAFFSVDTQRLLVPAILFAAVARLAQYWKIAVARLAQYWKIPVAISFPCLLLVSLLGFQGAAYLWDASMDELGHAEWVFAWDHAVVARTPMWYPWATIEWTHVQWRTVLDECPGYLISQKTRQLHDSSPSPPTSQGADSGLKYLHPVAPTTPRSEESSTEAPSLVIRPIQYDQALEAAEQHQQQLRAYQKLIEE
ncbi:hypothetical protein PsorP6_008033 [Peronosclerospora sorghi]|uniref:Uncharacterized protein n=1 Tax=Peronosclerospora sorghi TaxID=230839 RepID=A0ACC0WAT4_9STRA|nr:hypothetical protein PsorP6_008033 [Peronosclerospora sorghi]